MNYYTIKPSVAGELGGKTDYVSVFPSTVSRMEYFLDKWPCDDIIEAYPCFAVSLRLFDSIIKNKLTGAQFGPCQMGKTDYFEGEFDEVPEFLRLVPVGRALLDDFGLDLKKSMIISEKAKSIICSFNASGSDFFPRVEE